MKWAYGVTTVPSRLHDLLPQTLRSLAAGGFDKPRLFVDGARRPVPWELKCPGLEVTTRYPTIKTWGNWVLSLYELYIREPGADRYAMFQDDLVTYKNLKDYLEHRPLPARGYLNLYTFPSNQQLAGERRGWFESNQMGRGAVGLVFGREFVTTLLRQPLIVDKPQDCHRGMRSVDGAVVCAMKPLGWIEYTHNPSLLQHTGIVSSMRSNPHLQAESFAGEEFDAMELTKEVTIA